MAGLIPFNRRNELANSNSNLVNFYNLLDDFFSDSFMPARTLMRDTFKIDIEELEKEYLVAAELPGIAKEEIDINVDDEYLTISVNHCTEKSNDNTVEEGKNYIHRERQMCSMSRHIRLAGAKLDGIKAKLDNGVLNITIPKDLKTAKSKKIDIQ
ncbi:MAG: Hsp20/alpha crystallin family protein [Firmicutes bacterium]|nr:Hsp20/alpha crystallin family protein [Bacillota bacterium]